MKQKFQNGKNLIFVCSLKFFKILEKLKVFFIKILSLKIKNNSVKIFDNLEIGKIKFMKIMYKLYFY